VEIVGSNLACKGNNIEDESSLSIQELINRGACRDRAITRCNYLMSNGVVGCRLTPEGAARHFLIVPLTSPYLKRLNLIPQPNVSVAPAFSGVRMAMLSGFGPAAKPNEDLRAFTQRTNAMSWCE
jgi:hypothetical protein